MDRLNEVAKRVYEWMTPAKPKKKPELENPDEEKEKDLTKVKKSFNKKLQMPDKE